MKLFKYQGMKCKGYSFVLAENQKQAWELLVARMSKNKVPMEVCKQIEYIGESELDQLKPCVLKNDILPF